MSNHLEPCGADGSTGRKWTSAPMSPKNVGWHCRLHRAGGAGLFLETTTRLTFTFPPFRFPSPSQWAQCMAYTPDVTLGSRANRSAYGKALVLCFVTLSPFAPYAWAFIQLGIPDVLLTG